MNFIPYRLTSVFPYLFHTYIDFECQRILESESSPKHGQSKAEQALHLVENGNNLLSTEVSWAYMHADLAVSDKSGSN